MINIAVVGLGQVGSYLLNEYELYIDDYTKKSKYPDISK